MSLLRRVDRRPPRATFDTRSKLLSGLIIITVCLGLLVGAFIVGAGFARLFIFR